MPVMPIPEFVLAIVLGVISVALVALVLAQPGKDKNLSGAIAGSAETFFGKGKTARFDKVLNNVTIAGCVLIFVLILVLYCMTGTAA